MLVVFQYFKDVLLSYFVSDQNSAIFITFVSLRSLFQEFLFIIGFQQFGYNAH